MDDYGGNAPLTLGSLTIDQDRREVSVNGTVADLTAKEYAILELLVLRRGSVLTKDAIFTHLYGAHLYGPLAWDEAKIIDVFTTGLCRKLAVNGALGLVTLVWGRGYMIREQDGAL